MSKTTICVLVRISIIVVALCGICICAWWYPLEVAANVFSDDGMNILIWIQLIFNWAASVPCFIILVLAWIITCSFKAEVFTARNAKLMKIGAVMLFVDSLIYFAGNVVFMLADRVRFAVWYFFLVAVGLAFSMLLFVASYYVSKAAVLREENEGII